MTNSYGLDAEYFIRLFARELNPDVVRNQNPQDLAASWLALRVPLARKFWPSRSFVRPAPCPDCEPAKGGDGEAV